MSSEVGARPDRSKPTSVHGRKPEHDGKSEDCFFHPVQFLIWITSKKMLLISQNVFFLELDLFNLLCL